MATMPLRKSMGLKSSSHWTTASTSDGRHRAGQTFPAPPDGLPRHEVCRGRAENHIPAALVDTDNVERNGRISAHSCAPLTATLTRLVVPVGK